MKKAQMNISHSRFILFKLKIFGEIVTTNPKTAGLISAKRQLFCIACFWVGLVVVPVALS